MKNQICSNCDKAKAPLQCGICHVSLCKCCAQFFEEDDFFYLEKIPNDISHGVFCPSCFEEKVSPQIKSYYQLLERAKNLHLYNKNQGKETRFFKRLEKPIVVKDCKDQQEVVLRLAIQAAQADFNLLVDVEITSVKIKNESYQTSRWSGTGVPTHRVSTPIE